MTDIVILAGGTGTRLKEMTDFIPKPLIPIGGKPLIWHIMKTYAHYGHTRFIIALGYKQELFKQYFTNLKVINSDITVFEETGEITYGRSSTDHNPWEVTLVDTGLNTLKGGRIRRVADYIQGDDFFVSYGDSLINANLYDLLQFHRRSKKMVTITGVASPPRFGNIRYEGDEVTAFTEKDKTRSELINGGYFVFNKEILNYLTEDESCDLEYGALENLANQKEMQVFRHMGWWGCCDTLKDMGELQNLWESRKAPWKVWS